MVCEISENLENQINSDNLLHSKCSEVSEDNLGDYAKDGSLRLLKERMGEGVEDLVFWQWFIS